MLVRNERRLVKGPAFDRDSLLSKLKLQHRWVKKLQCVSPAVIVFSHLIDVGFGSCDRCKPLPNHVGDLSQHVDFLHETTFADIRSSVKCQLSTSSPLTISPIAFPLKLKPQRDGVACRSVLYGSRMSRLRNVCRDDGEAFTVSLTSDDEGGRREGSGIYCTDVRAGPSGFGSFESV